MLITPKQIKLVIFDWDGTLFDSVSQIVASLQWAALQHGIKLSATDAKNIIGLGLPEAMQVLFPNHPALWPLIQADYGKHYTAHTNTQSWFDGIYELLTELKEQGILLAVATGKNRPGLDRVLAHTQSEHLFCITRCAGETKSKPDPLMLEQILQFTQLQPTQAVMVGDSSYDLHMAQQIGMPSIGVTYGVHDEQLLKTYQPLAISHRVLQLKQILLSLI